jgi:YhhN family
MFLEYFFKSVSLIFLALLYYKNSNEKSMLYLATLLFATLSNLFFISDDIATLTLGMLAYLIYRILTIIIVYKSTNKFYLVSMLLGAVLFMTPLLYFIILNQDSFGQSLVPAVINVFLISTIGGLSVSNYLMEEGVKNTWLLISTILFAFLAVIFVIQKYYMYIQILDSLRVIVFMGAHYIFYRYMLLSEIKQ